MQTVSRSVERVFEVLELFRRERRPLSTADVRRALDLPHSSTVVLLTHLASLGYLVQNAGTGAYFPSAELHRLCAWIAETPGEHDPLWQLVQDVHARAGETTSVSRRAGLFSVTMYVRAAEHPEAIDVRPGITGGLLTLTVVGRTLLSTLPDADVEGMIAHANAWARAARVGLHHDPDAILRTVRHIRERGYLYDCNLLLPGVGAVSFPLQGPGLETPVALTIAARTRRMERHGARIVRDAERIVQRFRARIAAEGGVRPRRPAGAPAAKGPASERRTAREPRPEERA